MTAPKSMSRIGMATVWIGAPLVAYVALSSMMFRPVPVNFGVILVLLFVVAVGPAAVTTLRRWERERPDGRRTATFIFAAGTIIALATSYVFWRYCSYYRIDDAPGQGSILPFLLFPALTLAGSAVSLRVYAAESRRGRGMAASLVRSVWAILLLVVALATLEVSCTKSDREGEALEGGELGPFVRALFTGRNER
jgi:hypothetical protein